MPVKEINVLRKMNFTQPPFVPEFSTQWRILIHFDQIKLSKKSLLRKKRKYNICFDLFGSRYEYDIKSKWTDVRTADLNFKRLHYFFARSDMDVRDFCRETEFRLSLDDVIGTSRIFNKFSCAMDNESGMR